MVYKNIKFSFMLSVLILMLFCIVSCSPSPKVEASSIFDNTIYTLPITPQSANPNGTGTDFVFDGALSDIEKAVLSSSKTDGAVKTYLSDNFLLIENKSSDKTFEYWLVSKLRGDSFDLRMPFFTAKSGAFILLPYHLLKLQASSLEIGGFYEIEDGKRYETTYSIENFKNFYDKTGYFTTAVTENTLQVKWNGTKTLAEGGYVKYRGESFSVEFAQENGTTYVTYAISESEDA